MITEDIDTLDPEQLREKLRASRAEVAFKQAVIDKLTHENAILKRLKFAAKSEAYTAEQKNLLEETLDTDLAGNPAAFNPAELLLAALSACMVKGIERVMPILKFQLRGVEVVVDGVRQDVPPKMESIRYEIIVDTDESEQRLALLHENVKKYGTVFNTVAPGTELAGTLRRK